MNNSHTVDFSIIIPTCNRPQELSRCLDRLRPEAQTNGLLDSPVDSPGGTRTGHPFTYEIIISDDGQESKIEKSIVSSRPWTQWKKGPRKGPAANRNNGARAARGNWLVFLDDDCLPKPDLLDAYWQCILQSPDSLVIEGRIEPEGPKRYLREVAPINLTGGYLWSCNFAIQRNFYWNQLNGFCEEFQYPCMEDVDLRARIINLKTLILFCADAKVVHPWRIHARKFLKEFQMRKESTFLFYRRHPELKPKFITSIRIWIQQSARDFISILRSPNILDTVYFLKQRSIKLIIILLLVNSL
ncbi:MAG: glycosyltransferase [Opitutales bacterium]|nr:glycosyltransferase [Opitutales bacterium]